MCALADQPLEPLDQVWGEWLASELVHQLAIVDTRADAVDDLALDVPRGDQLLLANIHRDGALRNVGCHLLLLGHCSVA